MSEIDTSEVIQTDIHSEQSETEKPGQRKNQGDLKKWGYRILIFLLAFTVFVTYILAVIADINYIEKKYQSEYLSTTASSLSDVKDSEKGDLISSNSLVQSVLASGVVEGVSVYNEEVSNDTDLIADFIHTERPTISKSSVYSGASTSGVGQYDYGYQGTISGPGFSCGFSRIAGLSAQQSYIDNNYAAVVMDWSGYIGTYNQGGIACLIGAHNGSKPFGGLGNTGAGATVTASTSYGTYTYTVGTAYVTDANGVISAAIGGQYDLVLYTCYPFDAHTTNQRYVVGCYLN